MSSKDWWETRVARIKVRIGWWRTSCVILKEVALTDGEKQQIIKGVRVCLLCQTVGVQDVQVSLFRENFKKTITPEHWEYSQSVQKDVFCKNVRSRDVQECLLSQKVADNINTRSHIVQEDVLCNKMYSVIIWDRAKSILELYWSKCILWARNGVKLSISLGHLFISIRKIIRVYSKNVRGESLMSIKNWKYMKNCKI